MIEIFEQIFDKMREKFEKNKSKRGDSWKTTDIHTLEQLFNVHVFKFRCNFYKKGLGMLSKEEKDILQSDLADIANYCTMLFNRLNER